MTREEFISIILSGIDTFLLIGLAKEFEKTNPEAHKRITNELSKRPGALQFV